MVDALFVSPATPKPDLAFHDTDFCLLYFPYAPRRRRIIDVSTKLITRSLRSSLVDEPKGTALVAAKNGSAWRADKEDERT